MKKILTVLLLVFVLHGAAFAQSKDKWRAGSAFSLASGSTYVLTVFISETEWKPEDKRKLYTKLYEAEDWLKAQAALYGKTITFKGGTFGFDKTVIWKNIPSGTGSGAEPVGWISETLQKVGYRNSLEFYTRIKKETKCDNVLVLILANKKGRGYSMQYSREMERDKYFVEGSILYNQFEDGQPLFSAAIAHEFLHLFGAWDLYKTFEQTQDHAAKARKLYPDDIMLRISTKITDLKIDRLTAWLVGLNAKEEPDFESLRPTLHPK